MKRLLLIFVTLLFCTQNVFADAITISPLKEISTCKKDFQRGNKYEFKNTHNNEIITGTVLYYRPNSIMGQEAQIEIGNFRDKNNRYIPGVITIIPSNHKVFQEFMNYYNAAWFPMVRGSEIILKPEQTFLINNSQENNSVHVLKIKPAQRISTAHDELDVGDIVEFTATEDLFINGKLCIKINTPIYGIVDSIDENGWASDSATVIFKKFVFYDINGKKNSINSDLTIDGLDILKYKSNRAAQFFNYCGVVIRGKEVDITEKDVNVTFNLLF